jgi:hypothetical protein
MGRENVRMIKTQIDDVFTAKARDDRVIIPPWYIDGAPIDEDESGPWAPEQDWIIITEWYVQAGIRGSSNTTFEILLGDNVWYSEGGGQVRRSLTLDSSTKVTSQKVSEVIQTSFDHIIVSNRNWLKIRCKTSGGHENVTIQLYGRVM